MNVIGIDASTATTKSIIFNSRGKVLGQGSSEYKTEHPKPGWAEQNAEWWWKALKDSFSVMLKNYNGTLEEIYGISLTHQRYSFVPVDRNINPVHPAILWCDNRCGKEAEFVRNKIGEEEVYRETGYVPYVWSVYKILWLKNNKPEIYDKTFKWMLVQDYLVYKMTGELVTTSSSAAMMGCLQIKNPVKWSEDFINKIGLDNEKFIQRIVPAGDLQGRVTENTAAILGIKPGIPVYASAGDQPCGCIGAGVCRSGMVGVNGGTSCTIQGISEGIPGGDHKFILEISPVGKYAPEVAIHSGVSMLMKWLRNKVFEKDDLGWDVFYDLAKQAPVGNLGLINIPYFQGVEVPYWDPASRGIMFGFGIEHGPEHMVRALIEGMAYETQLIIELMEESTSESIDEIYMYGGSAVNDIWNQTFSDVSGKTVKIPVTEQTTALGAAICAASGAGLYNSIMEATENMVSIGKEYQPISSNLRLYSDIFQNVYKPFYGRVKDLVHNLSVITKYP